jgi:hypothetical protein
MSVSQLSLVLVLLLVMLILLDQVLDALRSKLVLVCLRSMLVQEVRLELVLAHSVPMVLLTFVVVPSVLKEILHGLINTASSKPREPNLMKT